LILKMRVKIIKNNGYATVEVNFPSLAEARKQTRVWGWEDISIEEVKETHDLFFSKRVSIFDTK
jgi:hypothetical protein